MLRSLVGSEMCIRDSMYGVHVYVVFSMFETAHTYDVQIYLVSWQKSAKKTDAERMFAGKLFHTRGPATAKFRVPSAVLILGLTSHLLSAERRCRLPATVVTGYTVTLV